MANLGPKKIPTTIEEYKSVQAAAVAERGLADALDALGYLNGSELAQVTAGAFSDLGYVEEEDYVLHEPTTVALEEI